MFSKSEDPYLWVDVQDADASSLHYFMNGVNLGAVEVTIIFTMFKIVTSFNISFHLTPGCEGVHHILSVCWFELPRGVCGH